MCTLFFLKVSGINLLNLHASNELAYGRMLLDAVLTRTELKDSLVFASKKVKNQGSTDAKRKCYSVSCDNRLQKFVSVH